MPRRLPVLVLPYQADIGVLAKLMFMPKDFIRETLRRWTPILKVSDTQFEFSDDLCAVMGHLTNSGTSD
jgi:hypothetical protein